MPSGRDRLCLVSLYHGGVQGRAPCKSGCLNHGVTFDKGGADAGERLVFSKLSNSKLSKQSSFAMPYVPFIYGCIRYESASSMVVSLSFFLREEWKVTKGRSGRPDEKGPVGGASCRSVCNSRGQTRVRKKTEPHLCRDSTNCKTRQDAPPAAALWDPHRPFFERPGTISALRWRAPEEKGGTD